MKQSLFLRWGGLTALLSLLLVLMAACGETATPATTTQAATTSAAAMTTSAAAMTSAVAMTTSAAAMTTSAAAAATTAGSVQTVAPVAGGNKTGVTDTEIKVGSWGPQSGTAAAYGVEDRTVDAYFKMINDQGGINGRKIKFIYEDDQYQAAKTAPLVKKMVEQDGVFSFVACIGTAPNLAVKDYLTEKGVPNIAFSTGAAALLIPPQKMAFGLLTNYTFEATVFAQYAADTLGAKKVAVLYQNDGFGKEGQQAFSKVSKAKGLEVVAEVSYENGSTDLSSQALKLQQSGADTVFFAAVPGPGSATLKEMDKLNYKPKIMLTFVLNDPQLFASAGKAADGVYTSSFTPVLNNSDDPKVAEYLAFMKKYLPNELPGNFSAWGYVGAQIFIEGLKRAGKDLSRENFVNAVESITDWKGSLAANISYGPNNRSPQNSIFILQYKDSKFTKLTDLLSAKL